MRTKYLQKAHAGGSSPRVMSLKNQLQTLKKPVKNHKTKKGRPIVTTRRKPHLNLSVSSQAKDILLKCEASTGFSKSVLVEMACVEYLAPKFLA